MDNRNNQRVNVKKKLTKHKTINQWLDFGRFHSLEYASCLCSLICSGKVSDENLLNIFILYCKERNLPVCYRLSLMYITSGLHFTQLTIKSWLKDGGIICNLATALNFFKFLNFYCLMSDRHITTDRRRAAVPLICDIISAVHFTQLTMKSWLKGGGIICNLATA